MDILQEEDLRDLSKNLNFLIPKNGEPAFQNHPRKPADLLECLFKTAEQPRLSSGQRVAAYGALAGFLEQGSTSTPELRELCLDPTIWYRALSVYLERSEGAAKPLRQLLATLIKMSSKEPDAVRECIVADATKRCLSIIYAREDLSCVKPAMLVLDMFLNKHVVSSHELVFIASKQHMNERLSSQELSTVPEKFPESTVSNFMLAVLEWAHYSDMAPAAGRLLVTFCENSQSTSLVVGHTDVSPPLWISPVQNIAADDDDMHEILERHIVPDLLRSNGKQLSRSAQTMRLLNSIPVDRLMAGDAANVKEQDIRFCLLVLRCIGGTDLENVDTKFSPVDIALRLIVHSSSEIRLSALSSLLSSVNVQHKEKSEIQTNMLINGSSAYHVDTDARARNDFISIIKKFLLKLELSLKKDARLSNSQSSFGSWDQRMHNFENCSKVPETSKYLKLHPLNEQASFPFRFFRRLYCELQPTASYQRHITALHLLSILITTDMIPISNLKTYSLYLLRSLLNLVMDAFDDVRASAASLLKSWIGRTYLTSTLQLPNSDDPKNMLFSRAEMMMSSSGRADYADGVGRLYDIWYDASVNVDIREGSWSVSVIVEHLLQELGRDVRIAENDLKSAVASAPIHGRLIALRYIISRGDIRIAFPGVHAWGRFNVLLQNYCQQIWDIVQPVLCIDSPEGHTSSEEDSDDDIGIKDTLSYSWRTLKEASSLLQAVVTNRSYSDSSSETKLGYDGYKSIGDLCFLQLAALRHRGAFSTVSQTFASCCAQCSKSTDPKIADLPQLWYQETLKCIYEKSGALTRRSAGLPAMITGVLVAYPSGEFFGKVINDLQETAMQAVDENKDLSARRLPQVHALNCLKDIFTNSRLGPGTDAHLASTIAIAVSCLGNDIWEIRNCGIMLFKALLTRLTGGSGSNAVGGPKTHRRFTKTVYEKYPQLAGLLVQLLQRSCGFDIDSSVGNDRLRQVEVGFPAMEIIDRAGIPSDHREVVMDLLGILLASPVWNIREKAARTLCTFTSELAQIEAVRYILGDKVSHNALHGHLLCLKNVCEGKVYRDTDDIGTCLDALVGLYDYLAYEGSCPFTATLYLEIVTLLVDITGAIKVSDDRVLAERDGMVPDRLANLAHPRFKRTVDTLKQKLLASDTADPRPKLAETTMQTVVSRQLRGKLGLFGVPSDEILESRRAIIQAIVEVEGIEIKPFWKPHKPTDRDWEEVYRLAEVSLNLMYNSGLYAPLELDAMFKFMEGLHGPMRQGTPAMSSLYYRSIILIGSPALINPDITNNFALRTLQNPAVFVTNLEFDGLRNLCLFKEDESVLCGIKPKEQEARDWATRLRRALDVTEELSMRQAAASSLEHFQTVLRGTDANLADGNPIFLGLYFAVYNALIDDDEDVRNTAARTASWILSRPGAMQSLNPVAAAPSLLDFISIQYSNSTAFWKEALGRVMGSPISDDLAPGTVDRVVRKMFCEAAAEDTSLFAEEKPNLFVDNVQEAERWAKVLRALPSSAVSQEHLRNSQLWVVIGLDVLNKLAAAHEEDGALGWTSRPEMFTAGMCVLEMAEVVLGWAEERSEDIDMQQLEDSLVTLLRIGTETRLHGQWQMKLERLVSQVKK